MPYHQDRDTYSADGDDDDDDPTTAPTLSDDNHDDDDRDETWPASLERALEYDRRLSRMAWLAFIRWAGPRRLLSYLGIGA